MKRAAAFLLSVCLLTAGCTAKTPAAEQPLAPTAPWEPEIVTSAEAESGKCFGNAKVEDGFVTGFENADDRACVTVTIPQTGFYDLEFMIKSLGGHKENYAWVDGGQIGVIKADGGKFERPTIRRVYMEAGEHEIAVSAYWGYFQWDKVTVLTSEPFDESIFDITPELCDQDATENTRRLYQYLCDSYGKYIISGQYCDTGMGGWENMKIFENTGKYPAVLGLDMAYYSQTGVDYGAQVSTTEQAIAYWEKNGIVTLCWHWLTPEKYITGTWYSAFRPEHTNINLTAIMNGEDEEGLALIKKDIGNIAAELLKMQEAGVPILWRPLHEAGGGWFWWGAEGPDTYKKLYILIYDTLTKEYGVHNLIWLWNGQDPDWYPGDEYVDIVGTDIYAGEHVYTSQIDLFLQTYASTGSRKMVVLSENGTMIDPELAVRDRAMWGFFATWSGEFVLQDSIVKRYSEQYTEVEMLKKVYTSDDVITRDELPDLHTYPIGDEAS